MRALAHDEPAAIFRSRILDALDRVDPARFAYIDRDRAVHACPACRSDLPHYLAVAFVGELELAELYCSRGCTPTLITAALGRLVR
jgi:hypothetical protein